ncbi:uncharacterized protein LOC131156291 isoform X2 [Malania oleifera]|uniref:uncharacterized protein LOC131156291 isoform X2 n=1 Tax=Malania oleifera TaxID=397392 RepID=UPI0025AE4CCB|nr:uncharacterized protein LOC131156291 isoform X2 [Malania oleifera]XP_057965827.1 uncharacterized protein LOC131156291 isoform X2 [Malania oleifera]
MHCRGRGCGERNLECRWRAMTISCMLDSCLQLEMHLDEMQIELENLVWDKNEVEEQMQTATKEHRMMELMFSELEEENDKAIMKIELLEGELKDLRNENMRLKEIQGEQFWSFKGQDDVSSDQRTQTADDHGIQYGIQSWKSSYNGRGILLQELMMQREAWEGRCNSKGELPHPLNTKTKAIEPIQAFTPETVPRNSNLNETIHKQRGHVVSQSLFSAVLSVLVGMIIWEAGDPCMPLVVALFIVVGISLKSVVQFFLAIKNKSASDAVALLSFNWFILGTLTYPSLPIVAGMLGPLALRFVSGTVSWLARSS